ncbi:uncharacterized protein LOC143209802 [Lasioglossum baleicum]|uniref:uncharacterized protein LOC143209802 n=1 Tax=Lasioglossum baleicum TaxID=434251 RepID=UPI003FCED9DA
MGACETSSGKRSGMTNLLISRGDGRCSATSLKRINAETLASNIRTVADVCQTVYVFFVERFKVWQNVHLLDMNTVGNSTSAARLHFHIQSWYDEVEDFDSAEFGYVNYTARGNLSYISFASATISRVGCGRAIYTVRPDESTGRRRREFAMALHTIPVGIGDRVETLVCNYGPLDRKTPGVLYEDGLPAHCPPRTVPSLRYGALCRKCCL